MAIHPTSVISDQCEIDPEAVIGPFCVIKGKVKIGPRTVLESHVSVGNDHGVTVIGADNIVMPGACVGGPPQDLKYAGEETRLEIGDGNTIRECVTVNMGTPTGGGVTKIGNNCLLMAYTHIAHDCILQDHVVIANSCQLAGHVFIEDHAKISGVCCINQFVRIGQHSFVAGDSAVNKDVLPFSIAQGKYAVCRATNKIGMERAGFAKEVIESVHKAIRFVTKSTDTLEDTLERITQECAPSGELKHFVDFIKASERGIAK